MFPRGDRLRLLTSGWERPDGETEHAERSTAADLAFAYLLRSGTRRRWNRSAASPVFPLYRATTRAGGRNAGHNVRIASAGAVQRRGLTDGRSPPRRRPAVSDRIDPSPALFHGSSRICHAMDRPRGSVGYALASTAKIERAVGRYEVGRVIGRGGAAVVYLAHQRDLRRQVALKELAPFYAVEREFAERFVEESRMIATLNHPNVVTVHEYFEDAGAPYIAMEYLARGSLRPFIGRLGIAEIVGVLDSVLAGLAHGESRGIVHRDLKPENLLVADDGRVKIGDFGVARAINNATPRGVVSASGTTIGTPAYMAPEVALGGTLSPVMDLYSLGIVVWELLTGRVPFEDSGSPAAVLYRHAYEAVPPVEAVVPGIDERLAEWLARMLRKRPEDRFESAQDAWDRLEDIVIELLGPRWRRLARLAPEPS